MSYHFLIWRERGLGRAGPEGCRLRQPPQATGSRGPPEFGFSVYKLKIIYIYIYIYILLFAVISTKPRVAPAEVKPN
ncbi:hypothetical protein RchiOBHm_Chr3g0475491 [Rosa chinensis]|uniref:Uncharacterized protein n=1 Tax=Rosa chinensis TaxID=74649 RepID=A0A2P6RCD5_ROSCH|nr:hypothetical protein RchiOBHm_Chr3g0475491 [Rosa chinensis]